MKKLNGMLEHLRKQKRMTAEVAPDGWFTLKQLAEEERCAESTMRDRIRAALRDGTVEKKVFKVESGAKSAYPTAHYRLK